MDSQRGIDESLAGDHHHGRGSFMSNIEKQFNEIVLLLSMYPNGVTLLNESLQDKLVKLTESYNDELNIDEILRDYCTVNDDENNRSTMPKELSLLIDVIPAQLQVQIDLPKDYPSDSQSIPRVHCRFLDASVKPHERQRFNSNVTEWAAGEQARNGEIDLLSIIQHCEHEFESFSQRRNEEEEEDSGTKDAAAGDVTGSKFDDYHVEKTTAKALDNSRDESDDEDGLCNPPHHHKNGMKYESKWEKKHQHQRDNTPQGNLSLNCQSLKS